MIDVLWLALAGLGVLFAAAILWIRPWIDDHYRVDD
jgi:hypothetical protein